MIGLLEYSNVGMFQSKFENSNNRMNLGGNNPAIKKVITITTIIVAIIKIIADKIIVTIKNYRMENYP